LKRKYVLDAGVLALYFAGRRDSKKYIEEAYSSTAKAYMCEVNLAEFLYNYARVFGWEAAKIKHSLIRSSPIAIISTDEALTLAAAKLKLKHYSTLSLADCYLIALAKQLKATAVTTDPGIRDSGEIETILLLV